MATLTNEQLQAELGRLDELRAALVAQVSTMSNAEKIKALEEAQPHVKPKTEEMEALLMAGYGFSVNDAKTIIKERDANPQSWPLDEYRKAKAMLAAYEAKDVRPSSQRLGWTRTRGL